MRRFMLTILLLGSALAVGRNGTAAPVSILNTVWEGTCSVKCKAKGAPAVKEKGVETSLCFTGGRDWLLSDSLGGDLSGTWKRLGDTKFEFDLSDETLSRVANRIRDDLALEGGELHVTSRKARATMKRYRATVSVNLKYEWVSGDQARGIRFKFKARTVLVSSPGPSKGSGPAIVQQSWFEEIPARMKTGRSSHTATLLDCGVVLIAGGYASGSTILHTAELFEPESKTFVNVQTMDQARADHTASRLPDGSVLLTGGDQPGESRSLSSSEIFEPDLVGFRATRSMNEERTMHTATVLPDGRILVTGGRTVDSSGETVWHRSAEVFDPAREQWSFTANEMAMYRAGHRATLLTNGRVLITGGSGTKVAEIYDPATNRFRTVEDRMEEVRTLHGSVRTIGGFVLLTDGGAIRGEIFDPTTETFTATSNSGSKTRYAAATFEFAPGEILIVGGIDFGASFLHASVEQFVTNYPSGPRYFQIPTERSEGVYLADPRAYSAWTRLADGRFLVTGGLGPAFDEPDLDTAFLFTPQK